ncbi:MAG: hypothetical protein AB4426_24435 [Xenococcaceae cyanobacterium]
MTKLIELEDSYTFSDYLKLNYSELYYSRSPPERLRVFFKRQLLWVILD